MSSVVKTVTGAVGGVGKMLGIGGGNTAEFDPDRHNYNPDKKAFEANNADQAKSLSAIQSDANQRMQGVSENEAREKQTRLSAALEGVAYGLDPSLAQNQLKQATDRNLKQQMGMAAAARGNVNPALMQRQLMQNQAATNQAAAGQSGDLRMQETAQARAQLADALGQQRAQDQASLAQNTATQLGAIQGQTGINDANRNALISREGMISGNTSAVANAQASDVASRRDNNTKGLGGLANGLSSMFSDERLKKDVSDGSNDVNDFLEALEAKSYEYKNPSHGKGPRTGVMAQDVEKGGPIGEQLVQESPEGKQIDMSKGFGAILASLAELHKRQKALEGKGKA